MIQHLKSYNLYSRFLFIGLILLASCGVSEDAARNSSQGQTERRDQPTKPSKSMLTVIPTWTNTPLPVSTRLATPLPTTSTISESTPVAYHLSLLPKATVVTVSLPQTLDKTPITKLPQKQDDITWVALNDSHIFWTTITEPGVIFRFPLHGVYSENSIEKIVNTQFKQGTLNLYIQFLVNNDWLIYIDTAYQAEATPWRLQALNLKTGVAQTILENLDLTIIWRKAHDFSRGLDSHKAYWLWTF